MKKSLRFLSFAFAGTLVASLLFTGCSSSEHRRTAGQYFDDQALNARVKTALLQDEEVAGMDVSTTTFDRVVQLSGFVADPEQKERAGEIVSEIPGVEDVVNNITVNPRAVQFGAPPEGSDRSMDSPSAAERRFQSETRSTPQRPSEPRSQPQSAPDFDAPSGASPDAEPDLDAPSASPSSPSSPSQP